MCREKMAKMAIEKEEFEKFKAEYKRKLNLPTIGKKGSMIIGTIK